MTKILDLEKANLDANGGETWESLAEVLDPDWMKSFEAALQTQAEAAVSDAVLAFERDGIENVPYGPWAEVQGVAEAHPEAGFPPGAEFFFCEGPRGTLRVMRFERGPAKLLVLSITHYRLFDLKPDRLPMLDEITTALELWPDNVPACVPVTRERGATILEVIQAGPAVDRKKGKIILLSDRQS